MRYLVTLKQITSYSPLSRELEEAVVLKSNTIFTKIGRYLCILNPNEAGAERRGGAGPLPESSGPGPDRTTSRSAPTPRRAAAPPRSARPQPRFSQPLAPPTPSPPLSRLSLGRGPVQPGLATSSRLTELNRPGRRSGPWRHVLQRVTRSLGRSCRGAGPLGRGERSLSSALAVPRRVECRLAAAAAPAVAREPCLASVKRGLVDRGSAK